MRALCLSLAIILANMSPLRAARHALQFPAVTQLLPTATIPAIASLGRRVEGAGAAAAFLHPQFGGWAVRTSSRGLCSARPTVLQAARGGDGAAELSDATLQKMTVEELKAMLRDRGLKVGGRKPELIERLLIEVSANAGPSAASAPPTKAPASPANAPAKAPDDLAPGMRVEIIACKS
mmetsp:Transcript_64408/g.154054  ORF Transcript_64408/g.154054 Transcript_64408/m.154054 type:complete len:179 (-) Transcript_64408:283-819(-)